MDKEQREQEEQRIENLMSIIQDLLKDPIKDRIEETEQKIAEQTSIKYSTGIDPKEKKQAGKKLEDKKHQKSNLEQLQRYLGSAENEISRNSLISEDTLAALAEFGELIGIKKSKGIQKMLNKSIEKAIKAQATELDVLKRDIREVTVGASVGMPLYGLFNIDQYGNRFKPEASNNDYTRGMREVSFRGTKDAMDQFNKYLDSLSSLYKPSFIHMVPKEEVAFKPTEEITMLQSAINSTDDKKQKKVLEKMIESAEIVDVYRKMTELAYKIETGLKKASDISFGRDINEIHQLCIDFYKSKAQAAEEFLKENNFEQVIENIQKSQEREKQEEKTKTSDPMKLSQEKEEEFISTYIEMLEELAKPKDAIQTEKLLNLDAQISKLREDLYLIKGESFLSFGLERQARERFEEMHKQKESVGKESQTQKQPAKEQPAKEQPRNEQPKNEQQTQANNSINNLDSRVRKIAFDLTEICKNAFGIEEVIDLAQTMHEYEVTGAKTSGMVFNAFYAQGHGKYMSKEMEELFFQYLEVQKNQDQGLER